MGKRIVKGIHGMGLKAKVRLVTVLTLMASVFMFQGLFKPDGISAAPTISNTWTNVYGATASTAAVDVSSSSFSVNTGSDRLLLVAVQFEIGTSNTTLDVSNVSYGGVSLTPIQTTGSTAGRSHAWMGYLLHSQIPSGANAVRVQATAAANTITGVQIGVASYTGVDQFTPINDSSQAATSTTSITFGSQIDYIANGLTVYCANNGGTAATMTPPTGFTTQTGASSTVGGFCGFVAASGVHSSAGSYAGTTGFTFGGTSTSTRSALVVASLRPATVLSNNANLNNLVLSSGTLNPAFASGTTSYTASVSSSTSSVTVTPTAQDGTASIKVNGATVASDTASSTINLDFGDNPISTVVTAQDGTTNKTYTVTVNRAPAAENVTTTAPLQFSAVSTSSITVTAPFTGDANGNNSCVIRWGNTDGSYPNTASSSKSGSSYVATISSGLQPSTPYYFQATFTDADNVPTTTTVTGMQATAASGDISPLIHSGANLGTKYNSGTWGSSYTCATCHSSDSTNIKRVQTSINGKSVSFLQVTGATNSFGNDQRPRLGKSTNVCEVCHTQTIFHRYSSNPVSGPLPGGYSHGNRTDCVTCHVHVRAFASGCDGCHGNPPTTANIDNSNNTGMVWSPEVTGATNPVGPGAHSVHTATLGLKCDTCHNGNTMPNVSYTIQVGFNLNGTNWSGFPGSVVFGSFSGRNPTNSKYSFINGNVGTLVRQTVASRNSCNVYCHGNWAGANGSLNASWEGGSTQAQCGTCHRATAGNPPTNGSHLAHAGASPNLGLGCDKCHGTHTNNTHANGIVTWDLTSISTSARYNGALSGSTNAIAPSSSYQTCSNLYCHSTVQPNGGTGNPASYFTPKWGDSATVSGCGACHTDMQASGTGNHLKHTAKYSCTLCHNAAGNNSTKHADGYIDVAFSGAGTGTTYTQARTIAGSDGYGTCSTISCHGSGASSTAWGNTLNCGGCHPIANLKGAHVKHLNTAIIPTYYNYTANRSTTTGYNFGCSNCHPLDVLTKHVDGYIDVTLNTTNTGNGGSVGYLRSRNSATADGLAASKGASGIYGTSGASVRCSASYCHSNAYASNQKFIDSPDWYGSYAGADKCAMCHGNSPNANDPTNQPGSPAHYSKNFLGFANTSSGHVIGIHAKNIFTGRFGLAAVGNTAVGSHGNASTSSTINCNMCHYSTVTTYANDKNKACAPCHTSTPKNPAELIADKTFHINGKVDVAFAPIRVKSKAQIRGTDYNRSLWSRQVGYKVSGAYDVAFKTFTTATQWNGTTKTCSNIACHNGASVKWGDTGGVTNCTSCHF